MTISKSIFVNNERWKLYNCRNSEHQTLPELNPCFQFSITAQKHSFSLNGKLISKSNKILIIFPTPLFVLNPSAECSTLFINIMYIFLSQCEVTYGMRWMQNLYLYVKNDYGNESENMHVRIHHDIGCFGFSDCVCLCVRQAFWFQDFPYRYIWMTKSKRKQQTQIHNHTKNTHRQTNLLH